MQDNYMELFYGLFEKMRRQGPGDEKSAHRLLNAIPSKNSLRNIADMGCGSGSAARFLAHQTGAHIDAVDNYQPFLAKLNSEAEAEGVSKQISTHAVDMTAPPFEPESFDLIWSEGAVYLIGFENALKGWKPLLRAKGYLVVTEMCWFTDTPSREASIFWQEGYPEMRTSEERIAQAKALGYKVLRRFRLPQRAWKSFHKDMAEQISSLRAVHGDHQVYQECEQEIELIKKHSDEFGYYCLLLEKKAE